MVRILHFLAVGDMGGIESLCTNIYRYGQEEHQFIFFWKEGMNAQKLRDAGAKVFFLNAYDYSMKDTIKKAKEICCAQEIETIVIHHASPLMWLAAGIIKKKLHIPFYMYAHSEARLFLGRGTASYLKQKLFFSWAAKKANGILAISNYVKESLLLYTSVKEKDVEVIYNGIDYAFYANGRQVNSEKTVITYCGRLVPEKGVKILLGALSEISKEKIECYILGEGVQRAELEGMAGQIENADIDIVFKGRQADVTPWLKQTDIFVYPVMCEEGFGLSVAEAMAAGAVCIVSAKGGLPELITDGENGFLVQNISEETLAAKLKEVISMKKAGKLEKLAENARRTARRFDIHTMVGQLEKIVTINSNRE